MTTRPVHVVGAPVAAVFGDVPGSKSIANRALVCAALADGDSVLTRVATGDDTQAMIDCLRALGVTVDYAAEAATATVVGCGGVLSPRPGSVLATRLAGTTSRFVTALAALSPATVVVDGEPPLRERPMSPLHDALTQLGASVAALETQGHLPVQIARARLRGGQVTMPGNVSSQYLTALMLIAPYLEHGLSIELTTELVSRPYVELTAEVMAAFGHTDVLIDERTVSVKPGRYTAAEHAVEVDASSASYPLALAAICGGSVTVTGLGAGSRQGDAEFARVLGRMGAQVDVGDDSTTVSVDGPLHGIEIDMADISDTVPTLAVVAAFATTPTLLTGVEFIRRKETDRIRAMCTELARCGVVVEEFDDGLRIHPCSAPHGARIETYHDHRVAMSMALLGCRVPGVEICDPDVVSKSWPGFWTSLAEAFGK